MTVIQLEVQAIAALTAAACALPGTFLVLRRMAMMSDAISHAILIGIVAAFFLTGDLNSPLLLVAAALTGLVTVALTEALTKTRLLREDASIGLVFPALFAAGVILISRYAGNVHLDTDAVLLGELAFAPFDRLVINGYDFGPTAIYTMSGILALNIIFLGLFYKEMKISTFDPGLAASLGFAPALLHYSHMAVVSLTAVSAFNSVGSILVIALMIAPPATAYLLTDRLPVMLVLSLLIGVTAAIAGYWTANILDASIAGSMAAMTGVIFLAAFLFAPERGVVSQQRRRRRQRFSFAARMIAVHLTHHEGTAAEAFESGLAHLEEHFRWERGFAGAVVKHGQMEGLFRKADRHLVVTDHGRELAREIITR